MSTGSSRPSRSLPSGSTTSSLHLSAASTTDSSSSVSSTQSSGPVSSTQSSGSVSSTQSPGSVSSTRFPDSVPSIQPSRASSGSRKGSVGNMAPLSPTSPASTSSSVSTESSTSQPSGSHSDTTGSHSQTSVPPTPSSASTTSHASSFAQSNVSTAQPPATQSSPQGSTSGAQRHGGVSETGKPASSGSAASLASSSTQAKVTGPASGGPANNRPIVTSAGSSNNTASNNTSIYRIVTAYSTVAESNGAYVTITSTVATGGPIASSASGNSSNLSADNSGFFSHTGAVAGVFVAIGVLIAIVTAAITCILRRQQRRARDGGMSELPAPVPENPFEPPPGPPLMRTVLVSRTDQRWSRPHTFHGDDFDEKAGMDDGLILPEFGAVEDRGERLLAPPAPEYKGPFSDYHAVVVEGRPDAAGHNVEMVHDAPRSPSPSPSTPSLYPVSEESWEPSSDLPERTTRPSVQALQIRKQAQEPEVGVHDYRPLTPPSSHAHSDSDTTPVTETAPYRASLLINRRVENYKVNAPVRPQRSLRRLA